MTRSIIIESQDGWRRATCEPTGDGVRVEFSTRMGRRDGPWRPECSAVFDRPLHVVLNEVHRLVWPAAPNAGGA